MGRVGAEVAAGAAATGAGVPWLFAGSAAGGAIGGTVSTGVEGATGFFATGAVGLMAGVSGGVGLGRAEEG